MKTKKILFSALIAIILTSCVSTSYFQVYKATPSDTLIVNGNLLVYEDENCKVSYNLWDEGGNIGFIFFNNTDKNIYLNLEESFFILNGVSYNYFRNRTFTNSANVGTSANRGTTATKSVTGLNYLDLIQTNKITATNTFGIMSSSGFSVSFNEEKIVCIPSYTSKSITEYHINETLFRDCDLFKYPNKKQIKSKSFSKAQSPLVFSNRISYTIGKSDELITFENEFYVSEISNFPESEMFFSKKFEYCGQKSEEVLTYFKYSAADKFYIKYSVGQDVLKH